MPASYYRLLLAIAASALLFVNGCTATRTTQSDAAVAQLPQSQQEASARPPGEMDTETTIWNILGIAKKQKPLGPETGPGVSPVLWQAALDTLSFAEVDSLDATAGIIVTKWYSPKGHPDQRLRITVFIKARALRSDSIAATIERQTRSAN